jgi:hypothetical protein
MTHGADEGRGHNPETPALSAMHLMDNLFSTKERELSAPEPGEFFLLLAAPS